MQTNNFKLSVEAYSVDIAPRRISVPASESHFATRAQAEIAATSDLIALRAGAKFIIEEIE